MCVCWYRVLLDATTKMCCCCRADHPALIFFWGDGALKKKRSCFYCGSSPVALTATGFFYRVFFSWLGGGVLTSHSSGPLATHLLLGLTEFLPSFLGFFFCLLNPLQPLKKLPPPRLGPTAVTVLGICFVVVVAVVVDFRGAFH